MAAGVKTGGRQKGTLNKATADVKALAQQHGPAAIAELARLMVEAESEAARVAAIKEIMDRAYGKSSQAMEISGPNGGPLQLSDDVAREKLAQLAERLVQK